MNTSIFSGSCFFILPSPWRLYITSVADVKDKVVCIGVRCKEWKSFYSPVSKHLLQKTLHFILYFCTFSLLHKGFVFKAYFELHAVIMLGDSIVQSIGESTKAWFSLKISNVFLIRLLVWRFAVICFYSMQLTMLRFISAENQVEQVKKKKGRLFAVTLKRAVLGNWNIFPEKNMIVAPLC